MKKRLKAEGADQLLTFCKQLKMTATDGRKRSTDVANTEQLLRLIQSVPSRKAEPFKLWLAQVGRERIEETIDPELSVDRALETYARLGYPADWINQRLQTIRARKELTDQWQSHGIQQGKEYAILTDEITRAWSGMSTRQYKSLKGLKKGNLRDNMNTLELALNINAPFMWTVFLVFTVFHEGSISQTPCLFLFRLKTQAKDGARQQHDCPACESRAAV